MNKKKKKLIFNFCLIMMLSVHYFFSCGSKIKRSEDFHFICFYKKINILGLSVLLFVSKMLASQPQFSLISGFKYRLKLDDCAPLCMQGEEGGNSGRRLADKQAVPRTWRINDPSEVVGMSYNYLI